MTDDDPSEATPPAKNRGGWLTWLVVFLIGVAAVCLASVYLPAVAKKLGLFAIALGLCCGWIGTRLASIFDIGRLSRGTAVLIVCAVIGVGQLGMTAEAFRLWRNANRQIPVMDPSTALALRMLDSQRPPEDPKTKEISDGMRQSINRTIEARREFIAERQSFAGYLRFRVSPLGSALQPFAMPIWICEIVLGSLAGTWLFSRLTRLDGGGPADKLDS